MSPKLGVNAAALLLIAAIPLGGSSVAVSSVPESSVPDGARGLSEEQVHHRIVVRLSPGVHAIEVEDMIDLQGQPPVFALHAGLDPAVVTPGWSIAQVEPTAEELESVPNAGAVPLEWWELTPLPEARRSMARLRYRGQIHHPIVTAGEEYQRSFSETPGTIAEEGVYLAGSSFWVPTFGDRLVTFDMDVVDLSPGWHAVSSGERMFSRRAPDGVGAERWRRVQPAEEVHLVAGPWVEYRRPAGDVTVLAFLRDDDPALAERYLDVTARYLAMYESALPPYPYPSFALVENFWETGYGMPGFTLLGPTVIRFPWILTSSYPHELLHNWWGNSVYVEGGNWCEGLTAYMADHLFAEHRGDAVAHRRAVLKKYTDFVTAENDFPLAQFGTRSSAASEAVGYGKALMVLHMVRRSVGSGEFLDAVSRFWHDHRFRRASFEDLAAALSEATAGEWGPFFSAWVDRAGAPILELGEVAVRETGRAEAPYALRVVVRQTQEEMPFPLSVPVVVTLEDRSAPLWTEAGTCGRDECVVEVLLEARPLRVDVDPAFDVMRRLDPLEVAPALSTVFGAEDPVFVLPAAASEAERQAWRDLAEAWARPGAPRLVDDVELGGLPLEPAWILGWDNQLAAAVAGRLEPHGVTLAGGVTGLPEGDVAAAGGSVVLVARSNADPALAHGWIGAGSPTAIPGLARKLPHYTRYSWLSFEGEAPDNVGKGTWRALESPLGRVLVDGDIPPPPLPDRPPLIERPPEFDPGSLQHTVNVLASPVMGGRGLGSDGLRSATEWVEEQLAAIGLEPAGDDGYRQEWSWTGGEQRREMELVNLVARIPGRTPALARKPVVLMAHLDHLGTGWPDARAGAAGMIHPGADDNASGVAVLLAVARKLQDGPPGKRPVLIAVVTGEEAGRLGSKRLMSVHDAFACVNLDTVGDLGDGPLYVLDAGSAEELPHLFRGIGSATGTPVELAADELDSSDQTSCLEAGIPGVQLFTGPTPRYHRPTDTSDTVDAAGMATVAEVALQAARWLADRPEPLTVSLGEGVSTAAAELVAGARRVFLGTVPDFTFSDPGVRVEDVVEGSPAEEAGILPGDVLLALDGKPVGDLRTYSELLKTYDPGDQVVLTLLSDGDEVVLTATLGER